MDPEDLREVITAYQKSVAETVGRFGGFVAKYMGDGVLIYFGYPQAHEDDAEQAVRAGLELIAAVGGTEDPRGPPDPYLHRDRNGRSDRVGRCSGASNRRLDAEPCGALAGCGRAEQRGDCREHSEARRVPPSFCSTARPKRGLHPQNRRRVQRRKAWCSSQPQRGECSIRLCSIRTGIPEKDRHGCSTGSIHRGVQHCRTQLHRCTRRAVRPRLSRK